MLARTYRCGLDAAIDVVGGRWKALILWALHAEPLRFGELKRKVSGISEKMLIQALRELEADEVVHREVFHEIPPQVDWGEENMAGIAKRRGVTPAPPHTPQA